MSFETPDASIPARQGSKIGVLVGVPERAFVVALQNGWKWLQENPDAWDSILNWLDDVELANVKALFATTGRAGRPAIRVGFPTADAVVPQMTVLVMEEAVNPHGELLGDLPDETDAEAFNGVGAEIQGELRDQMLTVTVTADHPDVALYLYRAADMILLAHGDWLIRPASMEGAGLIAADFASGGQVVPDPRDPDRLWGRQLRYRVTHFAGTVLPIPPPKVRAVVRLVGTSAFGVAGRVSLREPEPEGQP